MARERSGETQNERDAAWEHFLRPDGPDGSRKDTQKTSQTFISKRFLSLPPADLGVLNKIRPSSGAYHTWLEDICLVGQENVNVF